HPRCPGFLAPARAEAAQGLLRAQGCEQASFPAPPRKESKEGNCKKNEPPLGLLRCWLLPGRFRLAAVQVGKPGSDEQVIPEPIEIRDQPRGNLAARGV